MSRLNEMMEQVKKIKRGIGAQAILDEAYKILGNPIAMNNTEYALQAHTEVETDDPIWIELIGLGTFGEVTQRFFEKAGFIEEVANNRIAYLSTPYLKYDRINGKLFNKNNTHVSNLVMVACNKPFEEGDQKIFEIVCKLMCNEISQNEEIAKYEQAHHEWLIKYLIDGKYDKKMDIAQVEILYGALGPNVYLVVADFPRGNTDQNAVYYRDLLKKIEPEYKYAIYDDYVVILISTNDDTLNVAKDLKDLIKAFEDNNIHAGISGRFENLFEMRKHYSEAVKMMKYVLECRCSQRIFPFKEESVKIMEQIQEMESGKSIQYFLDKGPEIFGNPLLFHDMELNLLGYTKNTEIIDPIWRELITYGISSAETINLFKTEGFVAAMENTKGGAILASDKIKYDRISWKAYSKDNIMIGCLSIVNTDKPFTEDSLILFGVYGEKFSREVGKIDLYNKYGQIYSEAVINRLISGEIDDYAFYSEDIGNLYSNLMENLYFVVIDTTECTLKNVNFAYFRELFNWQGSVNRYAMHSNNIIIIISTDTLLENNNELDAIYEVFKKHNIYAGISSRFENIYESPKYYQEAVDALKEGVKDGSRRIFKYNPK